MANSPRPADVSADRDDTHQSSEFERQPDRERIAQRAYERYETRGREDGHDQDDWFEAERELQQRTSGTTTAGSGERTQREDGSA